MGEEIRSIVFEFFYTSVQSGVLCDGPKDVNIELVRRDEHFGEQILGSAGGPELTTSRARLRSFPRRYCDISNTSSLGSSMMIVLCRLNYDKGSCVMNVL